jgi:organic hydroperoxide reductase OsmC/OhrA
MEIFRNHVYQTSGESAKTTMSGISETEIGPPPEYGGSPDSLNPEEMLVASVNSCIMLVFFHFAKRYDIEIASYHSEAKGKV